MQALRALLEAGADVNARCRALGHTALHLAATFGHGEIADALREHGASTAILDNKSLTAAELASQFGHDALSVALTPSSTAQVST